MGGAIGHHETSTMSAGPQSSVVGSHQKAVESLLPCSCAALQRMFFLLARPAAPRAPQQLLALTASCLRRKPPMKEPSSAYKTTTTLCVHRHTTPNAAASALNRPSIALHTQASRPLPSHSSPATPPLSPKKQPHRHLPRRSIASTKWLVTPPSAWSPSSASPPPLVRCFCLLRPISGQGSELGRFCRGRAFFCCSVAHSWYLI